MKQESAGITREALEKIIHMIPTGINVFHYDQGKIRLIITNPAMIQMTGRDQSDACNEWGEKELYEAVHPDDRENVKKALEELFTGSHKTEVYYRSKNQMTGGYIWLYAKGAAEKNENGELMAYVSYTDITPRRNAEEELEKSRRRLTAAVEHSGLEYWEYDLLHDRAYMFDKSRSQYKLSEVLEDFPETWLRAGYIYPEDVEEYRRITHAIKDGQPYAEWDSRILDLESGNYRWKKIRYSTLFDSEQHPIYAVGTCEDVNAYVELEKRFIQTLMQNGLWVWDYDMRSREIIKYNYTEQRDPFGCPEKIITNVPQSIIERGIIYKEDVEKYLDLYRKIYAGEKQASVQVRGWNDERKEYVWQQLVFTTIYDLKGNPVRALCSSRDISMTKQMEQRFVEENRYREEMATSLLSTCRMNLTIGTVEELMLRGAKIQLSRQLETAADYRERMKHFFSRIEIPEEDNERLGPAYLIQQHTKGERIVSAEYTARSQVGRNLMRIHVDCKILRRPETEELIAFFYESDITQEFCLKNIMNSIIKYEYDLIGIIFASSNSIYSQARTRKTALPKLKSNNYNNIMEAFLRRYGCGGNVEELITSMQLKNVLKILENQETYTVEFTVREKDGRIRQKEVRYTYIDPQERLIAITRRDIEDIVQAEKAKQEQLEQALNFAEQANSAKSEFLTRMSHEMRTPMNAIVGLVALAEQEADISAEQLDYLEKIAVSGRHLMNLINDVLDMSKIESGELTLHPEKCCLMEMVEQVRTVIGPLCEQKKIRFTVKGEMGADYVMADQLRLGQVLINLLSNAVKFTPEGGNIDLLYEGSHRGMLLDTVFEVRDDGIGISEEFQERMFRPFTQEEREGMLAVQGTGLGLSITKAIVDRMGGSILVNSHPEEGTTFQIVVSFPWIEDNGNDTTIPKGQQHVPENMKDKRILLVEDHPMNQLIAKRILQNNGIRVVTADNGAEGVGEFLRRREGYFDAILMDIRMPGMDGLTAAKTIRKTERADAISVPIIAMTANAFDEDVEKTKDAGMNAHLAKPVQPSVLLETLEQWVKKKRVEEENDASGLK